MSRPDPRTFSQLREVLHSPAAYAKLNDRSKAFVDAMKAREDADKVIAPQHDWLMLSIALREGV